MRSDPGLPQSLTFSAATVVQNLAPEEAALAGKPAGNCGDAKSP